MSGTASQLMADAGGILLPAPVMRTAKNHAGAAFSMSDGSPVNNVLLSVTSANLVSASVHGLPKEIMDNLDKYKPQLELMRYVRRRSNARNWSRSFRSNGYVHPSHGPTASGNGSHTHGGAHSGIGPAITAIRATEWAVTNWGQVIDVTQGMIGFMQMHRVNYRQPSAGAQVISNLNLPVPSGKVGYVIPGKRFPYGREFFPGYYKFRWSVVDPTDDRGQRISGPLSDTVSITTSVFPFIPEDAWLDTLDNQYHATASLDTRLDPRLLRAWVGSVSRLPT